ncbi:MAG: phage tail tube protein [Vulcanimicrobiaceae bacterium]
MVDCCYAAGGRVSITAGGQIWSARSSVTIEPINYERSVNSNQDGTIYTTYKPTPATAEIVLSDACGMKIEDIMGCPIDVTIQLVDVRRTYLFTKAVVVGRPKIDTETGAISGLTITANQVTYTNN